MSSKAATLLLRAASISAVLLAVAWFAFDPGFEPAVTFAAGLAALLASVIIDGRTNHENVSGPPLAGGNALPLSPILEDALAIAEFQSRRDGRPVTSTRYVFAALRRVRPDGLRDLLEMLEKEDALPPAIDDEDALSVSELSYDRPFSDCITESLGELSKAAGADQEISAPDLFVDVAKYGHGASVARLRQHGIDSDRIDQLTVQYNVPVQIRRRR